MISKVKALSGETTETLKNILLSSGIGKEQRDIPHILIEPWKKRQLPLLNTYQIESDFRSVLRCKAIFQME